MKCPVDTDVDLVMSERQGIEIDYCPRCRGVWLDRGEIDKLIERSIAEEQRAPTPGPNPQHYAQPHSDYASRRDYDDDDDHHPRSHGPNPHHRRKESWFGDLFD